MGFPIGSPIGILTGILIRIPTGILFLLHPIGIPIRIPIASNWIFCKGCVKFCLEMLHQCYQGIST